MSRISLNIPGLDGSSTNIPQPPGFRFTGPDQTSLGYVVSEFIQLAFYVAGFLVFIWFAWGVFEYIIAEGQKESIAKARRRIIWSMVGFVALILAIFISIFARTIFPQVEQFYQGRSFGPIDQGQTTTTIQRPGEPE